jgi:hypothetical protein
MRLFSLAKGDVPNAFIDAVFEAKPPETPLQWLIFRHGHHTCCHSRPSASSGQAKLRLGGNPQPATLQTHDGSPIKSGMTVFGECRTRIAVPETSLQWLIFRHFLSIKPPQNTQSHTHNKTSLDHDICNVRALNVTTP